MTKHAIVLASVLALTACQSGRNGDATESSVGAANTSSATGSTTTYGQSPPSTTTSSTGSFGSTSIGSTIPAERETMIPPGSSASSPTIAGQSSSELGGPGLARQNPDLSSPAEPADSRADADQSLDSNRQPQPDTAANRQPDSSSAGNEADVPLPVPSADSAPVSQSGTAAPGQTGTGSLSGMSAADRAITQSVTNSLAASGLPTETMNSVQVRTTNGRVILSGQVNTQVEKQRIESQVRQTPGVRTVINQLRVVSAGSDTTPENQTSPAPENRTLPGSSLPPNSGTGSSSNATIPQ